MQSVFEKIWHEPRAPDTQGPLRRDWVLVSVLALVAITEGIATETVVWRSMTILLTLGIVLTLAWRRTHPLYMTVIAFGASAVVQTIALGLGVDWRGLNCNAFVVIFPYALFRWGSGREAIIGLVVVAVAIAPAMYVEQHTWLEILGASMFLLIPAALGGFVRHQDGAQRISKEQVRLQERETLARELHDTVAHHVSAIAIQAQAGRALAATRPEAPLEVLGTIEEAASRTLTEMRQIVGMLRDDSQSVQAPVATLTDIKRLASDNPSQLNVEVNFSGELDQLGAALESTLFRLTQEALTNAVRHARAARNVIIQIVGDPKSIRLTVVNDGEVITHQPPPGLGLRGMVERVELLGGTIVAEPGSTGGWIVKATLPKYASG